MILSVSRRTDIPHYYADWFFGRLRAGFACVRNPVNPRAVSRVSLSPELVDGIVFWTKNPAPMLDRLDLLRDYAYYFQFTLNSYGPEVECRLPDREKVLIPAFLRLSSLIGPQRVIWRYDPIFLSRTYTAEYHLAHFEALAARLAPYTNSCIISFLDHYRSIEKRLAPLGLTPFPPALQGELAARLAAIARRYGLSIASCAEAPELQQYGVAPASCIDPALLGRLLGCPLAVGQDKNQRPHCGCAESVDIGAYQTCPGGCRYCYANHSEAAVPANAARHDPAAPLLTGQPGPGDRVTDRRARPLRQSQLPLGL